MRAATIYQKLQVSQYLKLLPNIHLRSLAIEMQFEYNALYLALAAFMPAKLVTADLRLYNAVSSQLEFVQYLGNY